MNYCHVCKQFKEDFENSMYDDVCDTCFTKHYWECTKCGTYFNVDNTEYSDDIELCDDCFRKLKEETK